MSNSAIYAAMLAYAQATGTHNESASTTVRSFLAALPAYLETHGVVTNDPELKPVLEALRRLHPPTAPRIIRLFPARGGRVYLPASAFKPSTA